MECEIPDCGIRNLVYFYIQPWVRLQCTADKGQLPFVKIGQPNWSIHKRNVLVRPNCDHSLRPTWSSIKGQGQLVNWPEVVLCLAKLRRSTDFVDWPIQPVSSDKR